MTKTSGLYFCGICGSGHETIEERSACESKCVAQKQKEQEELKKKQFEEDKVNSEKALNAEYKQFVEHCTEHCKKYGSIRLDGNYVFDDDLFPTLRKIFGWF